MSIKTLEIETRGIQPKALMDYFLGLGGQAPFEGIIAGQDWKVEIVNEQLYRMGALELPRVKLIFKIDETRFDKMIADFRFHFLTLGG